MEAFLESRRQGREPSKASDAHMSVEADVRRESDGDSAHCVSQGLGGCADRAIT